jgi:hypothetical protein
MSKKATSETGLATIDVRPPVLNEDERGALATIELLPVEIDSPGQHDMICDWLKGWRSLRSKIDAHFEAIKKPINALRTTVLDMQKAQTSGLDAAIKAGDFVVLQYREKLRKERELAEAKARAEALAQAEEERKAKVEAVQAVAAQTTNEQAREELQQMADALANVPVVAAPVVLEPVLAPKAGGFSTTTRWHAEVVDLKALVLAVARGEAPLEALLPNMPFLNSQATNAKSYLAIPGVKAVPESSLRNSR